MIFEHRYEPAPSENTSWLYPASWSPPLSDNTHECSPPYSESDAQRTLTRPIQVHVSSFNTFCTISPLTTRWLLAKKQRVTEGIKILLDIAKESADWFPPLKSALGGVSALVKHYEVLGEQTTAVRS